MLNLEFGSLTGTQLFMTYKSCRYYRLLTPYPVRGYYLDTALSRAYTSIQYTEASDTTVKRHRDQRDSVILKEASD
jgi:hypothetical protein